MKAKPLLIGQLAASAGIKPDSVRFYERSGLLPKPQRSATGYRVYDRGAVNQLRFIKLKCATGSLRNVRANCSCHTPTKIDEAAGSVAVLSVKRPSL